jgi:hypothetical protein
MAGYHATADFEPVIWARLIQAPKTPISPEAADYLLFIDFSVSDDVRMQELMDRSNQGALTSDEKAELDGYVNIANVLSVMHSQARVALKKPGFESMRDVRKS